jgi:peptide/nickel transport system ATP-binding protein
VTCAAEPLLKVRGLCVEYSSGAFQSGRRVRAVENVSFDLDSRRTLGLVGESGSGKSSVGRALAGLAPVKSGSIRFRGVEVAHAGPSERRALARLIGVLFQDPWGSLNPRMTAGRAVREAPLAHDLESWRNCGHSRTEVALARVGLPADAMDRYPHEFSGGQRQRVALARALALEPVLLVLDEPTSALDVSMAAQILNLLADLQAERGLAYLLIGHDLALVESMSDDIAVMYAGRLVESGPAAEVLASPAHPYSRMLIETAGGAIARGPETGAGAGPTGGCPYAPRCPRALPLCNAEEPQAMELSPGHVVRCNVPDRSHGV